MRSRPFHTASTEVVMLVAHSLTKRAGFVSCLHLAELSVLPGAITGRFGAAALAFACLLGGLAPPGVQAQNITLAPVITSVAGTGGFGYSGDGGPATSAALSDPSGVAVDSAGTLYIADLNNSRIRRVDVTTSALSFGSLNVGHTSLSQTVAVSDVGNAPLNFSSLGVSSNFQLPSVGNDCVTGTPLAVGGTCALGVAFAPTVAGNPLTGTLTVRDDAFNSPQSVSLSGTAVAGPPADTTPPTITITSPANGAAYNLSQSVVATYSCTDPSGVASCSGTVANGTAIDTSPVGTKIFTEHRFSRCSAGTSPLP